FPPGGRRKDPSAIRTKNDPLIEKRKNYMSTKKKVVPPSGRKNEHSLSSSTEELLLAALERGGDVLETGRYLISYRGDGAAEGLKSLKAQGFQVADARDYKNQAVTVE